MKKLFYILVLTFVTSMALTSCTEEEVNPAQKRITNGGGGASLDPL